MPRAAGVLARVAVIAAAVAFVAAVPMRADEPGTGVAVAAVAFLAAGAVTDRWWTALLVPGGFALWMLGAYASDPGSFMQGTDAPAWVYAAFFFGTSVAAGLAVALGIALRRTLTGVRLRASPPARAARSS